MRRWADLPIGKKLFTVVGIMAVLVAGELFTVRFAMRTLSAVRAFVAGEGEWSKAQKNAVLSLQRYVHSHAAEDYDSFLAQLEVPAGDHRARVELLKPTYDGLVVREGFSAGNIHPEDIDPMVELLRRFHSVSYISRAIALWTQADALLAELRHTADEFHARALAGAINDETERMVLAKIDTLNSTLTGVERGFSNSLGEGSRWLEKILLFVLALAVLMAETVGLSLAFFTSRAISRGLAELTETARRIGRGELTHRAQVSGQDEIGQLGRSLDEMGDMLQRLYDQLEQRVMERTAELARLARENAELADKAQASVIARDEFISIASHELRNPLAPIVMALQLMQQKDPSLFVAERTVIERQMKHVVRLVDDLLDASRITRGRVDLHKERLQLNQVVRLAVEMSAPVIEEKNHSLWVQVDPDLWIDGDPVRLGQVVSNLLTNAAKYTEPGGRISIHGQRVGSAVTLRVRDSGMGIENKTLPHVFDLFVQETQAIDRSQGGLGLGLTIVRSLVLLHGGTVSAASGGRGQGSEFVVSLPASPTPETHTASKAAPLRTTTTCCILAVDDNADALEMLRECLKSLGHDAHCAKDGSEALRLAEQVGPTVAVLDIGLPEMDGYELARRLRHMFGNIRLIALTGYGQPSDRQRAAEAGFDVHLVKPVSMTALFKAIETGVA